MSVIIVGGIAGGASCAARLRRLDERAEIRLGDRGPYLSYANLGLPYHVADVIPTEPSLVVATEQHFRENLGIDARTKCEAVSIDRRRKTVDLRNVTTGEVTTESYDKLSLSPGAQTVRPHLSFKSIRGATCRPMGVISPFLPFVTVLSMATIQSKLL